MYEERYIYTFIRDICEIGSIKNEIKMNVRARIEINFVSPRINENVISKICLKCIYNLHLKLIKGYIKYVKRETEFTKAILFARARTYFSTLLLVYSF